MSVRTRLERLLPAALLLATVAVAQEGVQPVDDQAMADAVERQLTLDRAVDVDDIDLSVTQGILQLTGRVDSLLDKQRATDIAEMVRGVRAISNRIDVVPLPSRWDADIRKDIVSALLTDPATDSYEVRPAVENGVVTLRGTVDSWAEKELSAKVAMGVRGVVGIENELKIKMPDNRPDSEIEPEIERRLHWDVLVDDALINVDVLEGEVELRGTVGCVAEKRQAHRDAFVAGVKSVDARGLTVRPWAENMDFRKDKYARRSDKDLRETIEWAALYDPRVLSFRIEPDVENGWVTLRGKVDNLMAKRAAEQLARHTVGVTGVTNLIKVRFESARPDKEIAFDVRRSLHADPHLESYEIDVEVNDGKVTLRGDVDNFYERAQAEYLAARIRGVANVRNTLVVPGASRYLHPEHHYVWRLPFVPLPVPAPEHDDQIESNIRSELWWTPFINSRDIEVDVENGVATLKGTVSTMREYHAAERNALEGGAKSVVNELRLEQQAPAAKSKQ